MPEASQQRGGGRTRDQEKPVVPEISQPPNRRLSEEPEGAHDAGGIPAAQPLIERRTGGSPRCRRHFSSVAGG
jgi:hypothetical protein